MLGLAADVAFADVTLISFWSPMQVSCSILRRWRVQNWN